MKHIKTDQSIIHSLWYNRFILGEWALAHGAIYDNYDSDNEYSNPFQLPTIISLGLTMARRMQQPRFCVLSHE